MFKYKILAVSLWCLLLIDNTYSNPIYQNRREYNIFEPEFWSSLFDDYLNVSDDISPTLPDNFRPVVVCSPPNCTIVINVQNGGHQTGATPPQPIPHVPVPVQGTGHGAIPVQGNNLAPSPSHGGIPVQMPSLGHGGVAGQPNVAIPGHNGAIPNVAMLGHNIAHQGAAQPGTAHGHGGVAGQPNVAIPGHNGAIPNVAMPGHNVAHEGAAQPGTAHVGSQG